MEAYQFRFLREYNELIEKYGKLLKLLRAADMGELDFKLNCPIELLKEQADIMKKYIDVMLARDKYEKVGLTHYNFGMLHGDEYGVY